MDSKSVISLKEAAIYQHKRCILKDVNFDIKEGEFVYLIGKTGSGKSSLLKTLYADLPAKEGELSIADYNLRTIKSRDIPMLRRKIGIVFQDFQLLFDRKVEDNLYFVLEATGWNDKAAMSKRIDEVLEQVGLPNKRKSMPHQLSGGEQQSIAIARALLNDPALILADEPTGNLDPETTNDIMNLLRDICSKGKTIFMATHNYNLILKYPSRIIKCDDGTVIDKTTSQQDYKTTR
ncbi:MAG: ATP-binding cassette domain-containing protein [Bacteroidales bacterium]|nr:ATP-binding cassette domain-containing protein [Bacteroidales bacterium]